MYAGGQEQNKKSDPYWRHRSPASILNSIEPQSTSSEPIKHPCFQTRTATDYGKMISQWAYYTSGNASCINTIFVREVSFIFWIFKTDIRRTEKVHSCLHFSLIKPSSQSFIGSPTTISILFWILTWHQRLRWYFWRFPRLLDKIWILLLITEVFEQVKMNLYKMFSCRTYSFSFPTPQLP